MVPVNYNRLSNIRKVENSFKGIKEPVINPKHKRIIDLYNIIVFDGEIRGFRVGDIAMFNEEGEGFTAEIVGLAWPARYDRMPEVCVYREDGDRWGYFESQYGLMSLHSGVKLIKRAS